MLLKPLLLSAILLGGVQAQAPADGSSFALFTSTCMEGEVRLKKGAATPIKYRQLPEAAKRALGQAAVRVDQAEFMRELRSAEVPNSIYRIGSAKNMFLVAPASAGGGGDVEESCAVIWKGENFQAAVDVILPKAPPQPAYDPRRNPLGLGFVSTTDGGLRLTAAALKGWIVLKASPAAPETPGEP